MSSLNRDDQKQKSKLGIVIKWVFVTVFPAVKFFKLNRQLSKAAKITKDPWFKKQLMKNYMISIALTLPVLLGSVFAYSQIKGNRNFSVRMEQAKNGVLDFDLNRVEKAVTLAMDNKAKTAGKALGLSILLSALMGLVVFSSHPLISDTKKLVKLLQTSGVFDRDEERLALSTPLGSLIDITGSTPREISENKRIWIALNIEVRDYVEDPDQRSTVFFKTAFKLKDRYDYVYKD